MRIMVFLFLLYSCIGRSQLVVDTFITVRSVTVNFESAKWNLDHSDSTVLNDMLNHSFPIGYHRYTVMAHTDSDGSEKYNMDLSEKRCQSVKDFLVDHSIPENIIYCTFFGESRPLKPNRDALSKRLNRRVTINLDLKMKLWDVSGKVIDNDELTGIDHAQIILHSKFYRDTTYSDSIGNFIIKAPVSAVIGLDVLNKNYLFDTKMMKSDKSNRNDVKISIKKAIPGRSVDLNRFFFVGDRAIILDEYVRELDNLETFMKISPEICVEIVGHVNEPNSPPSDSMSFEYNLSVARSKLIYDNMVERGINPDRMFYSGKGNWEMLFPSTSDPIEMQRNRRVEVIVRKCGDVYGADNANLAERFDYYSMPKRNY